MWKTTIVSETILHPDHIAKAEIKGIDGYFYPNVYAAMPFAVDYSDEISLVFWNVSNNAKIDNPIFDTIEQAQKFCETEYSDSIQHFEKVLEEAIEENKAWRDFEGNLWVPFHWPGHEDSNAGIFCPKLDKKICAQLGDKNLQELVPKG